MGALACFWVTGFTSSTLSSTADWKDVNDPKRVKATAGIEDYRC
jgi:hypothetical protein